MSYLPCSYCGDFADTDDEGEWDVPNIKSGKVYEFVCGSCVEKFLTEEGKLDPDLPEHQAYIDKGDAMAARAEDEWNRTKTA